MPKQYVVFGRPVPRLGSRHLSLLLVGVALFAIFSLLFTLPSSIPVSPSLQAAGDKLSMPASFKRPWMNKINPFKQPAHAPPRQKHDTDGESWWYADWKWLSMPFSSSVTFGENRALLPVLKERTPIYCYYDNTVDQDRAIKDADSDLLLAWRRAWWAQGFKPIILSPAEATNNPMYEELQKVHDMTPSLKTDVMPWLAWENMGGGLLAHRFLFPMGAHHDPFLAYLRHGEFPKLTRWKDLDDGLFVGPKNDVAGAIKLAMASPHMKEADEILAAMQTEKEDSPFTVEDPPQSLGYYSQRQIQDKYGKLDEAITASRASGLKSLNQLINSHLHTTWQNLFPDGIAVVKPLPEHTTLLTKPALELASRLAHCSESPMPETCPPNLPHCTPCDDTKPLKVTTPPHYENTTSLYTLGSVPHPYTTTLLTSPQPHLDIAWIRRQSPRDAWITALTATLFPNKAISSAPRILRFKEAVASDTTSFASLWLPAEQQQQPTPASDELDWHFGFALPDEATYPDDPESDVEQQRKEEKEQTLLTRAQTIIFNTTPNTNPKTSDQNPKPTPQDLALRDAVEAWNLADTEAWRFARAYLARKTVERQQFEDAEAKYAGGMGTSVSTSDKKKKTST